MSLAAIAQAIRDRQRSATEVATECLRRIEATDAELHAFIAVDGERVLEAAAAADARRAAGGDLPPLLGVPIAIKDNLATADLPTTGGTRLLRDYRPTEDADVVRAIKAAGAIVLGKTNLHEAAFGITSKNPHYGVVGNPVAPGCIAGGSSGGTSAAVAAEMAPAGIGTDTGGSVRVPAALCGGVGLRPTTGRVGTGGLMSLSWTCDAIGPMTRSVADAALLFAAMAGAARGGAAGGGRGPAADSAACGAPSAAGLRVGVLGGFLAESDPATASAFTAFVARLEAAGAHVDELLLDGAEAAMPALFDVVLPESWIQLQEVLDAARPGARLADCLDELGPDVRAAVASEGGPQAAPVSAQRYLGALRTTRPALQAAAADAFDRCDVLLTPTTPAPAVRLEEDPEMTFNGARVPTFQTFIRNCCVASFADLPAISIPIGASADGRPIGAQLIGPHGADERLLAVAAACEEVAA